MRPLHHKIFGLSWLSITWVLRRLFWCTFLLAMGTGIGLILCICLQLSKEEEKSLLKVFILGISIPVTFILWLIFYKAHKARFRKEKKHSTIEYLEELKERNALSEEDFIKEKIKILED